MGGLVAVTIRMSNGDIVKMGRWTNPLSSFLLRPRFLEDTDAYLEDYIRYDHEEWSLLAPLSYGLIVIDCVTKKVLHSQGYTSMVRIFGYPHYLRDPYYSEIISYQIQRGAISVYTWDDETSSSVYQAPLTSLEDLILLQREHCTFKVDISPWEVIEFPEGCSLKMREAISDLGFPISEEEIKEWDKFLLEEDE